MQYKEKITRLVEIKNEIADLKAESESIEAEFLKTSESDLADTKLKTVSYADDKGNKVTATMSDNVKLVYPSFLKNIFGEAYKDVVTEETSYKLSAPAKRLLGALWKKEFCEDTLDNVINKLSCDEKSKKALAKKLKGAKFETDKKNLIKLAGLSESDASDTAYLVSEIVAWESFMRLLKLNHRADNITKDTIKEALTYIDGAVIVEETPKITVDVAK